MKKQKVTVAPMQVRLLGPLLAEIDHRPVKWLRKRDRQIFKYVALSPEGSVSRAELARLFWHGAERDRSAQSLRTVCSNIRKAIGNVVGSQRVDDYFYAGEYVSIDPQNVTVDVHRFTAHADAADAEYERGNLRAAYADYRSAVALYHGDLLAGDPPQPWVARRARALKSRHALARDRIAQMVAGVASQGPAPESSLGSLEALTFIIDMYLTAELELPPEPDVKHLVAELIRASAMDRPS